MFEYVQEREVGKRLEPRTMVYVITVGDHDRLNSETLTERGENQLFEMARSRVASGVRILYSATNKIASKSADVLAKEFESKIKKLKCLDLVKFGNSLDDLESFNETLKKMWQNEEFLPEEGESFAEAKDRFGTCMGSIVAKHPDDVVAVIVDPLMALLFHSHVTAAPLNISDWQSMGFASCASYEYSMGWSVVIPPDNSFLSDPTTVADTLPEELL
ncbi:MAG: histidine phosphatase family protein [Candidatus Thorarchaeota archaeon]|nr:histidine phosphatase family protein [Candidatus Thorarchaeota archaeon]